MESVKTTEAKIVALDERAVGAERELCEAKAQASKVEQKFLQ